MSNLIVNGVRAKFCNSDLQIGLGFFLLNESDAQKKVSHIAYAADVLSDIAGAVHITNTSFSGLEVRSWGDP